VADAARSAALPRLGANVIDALRGILELRFGEHPPDATAVDSEPLELVIGA